MKKNITYKHLRYLLLSCMGLSLMMLCACEEDERNAPMLTGVRNYAPSPDDTVLQSLQPGQWVTLTGRNLSGAKRIIINGVSVGFNSSLLADRYAVVQVPAVIPFPIIPDEMQNKITYVTDAGSTTFDFDVTTPAPVILSISNENATAGEEVFVYGSNLFLIKKLNFAGREITEYTSANDGTYVSFILPELTESEVGPVIVETKSGGDTTVYNVNDPIALCNFDNINTMSWGTGTDDNSTNFPGNSGRYARLTHNGWGAWKTQWWELGINTQDDVVWIPAKDTAAARLEDYAVKFEINVPKEWKGSSFFIARGYDFKYIARFEPWKLAGNKTTPVSTKGKWVTVTVPFTQFRTKANDKDGTGVPPSNIRELFQGNFKNNNKAFNMWPMNDTPDEVPAIDVAVDNIRIVKIK